MSSVVKISEAASLALHTLAVLAAGRKRLFSTHDLAQQMGISAAHLSKVLQRLAHAGLVRGSRGPRGGFELNREPRDIRLLEIYEALEGPLAATGCLYDTTICNRSHCIFGGLLEKVSHEVHAYFANTNLQQLSETIGSSNGQGDSQNHPH